MLILPNHSAAIGRDNHGVHPSLRPPDDDGISHVFPGESRIVRSAVHGSHPTNQAIVMKPELKRRFATWFPQPHLIAVRCQVNLRLAGGLVLHFGRGFRGRFHGAPRRLSGYKRVCFRLANVRAISQFRYRGSRRYRRICLAQSPLLTNRLQFEGHTLRFRFC